MGTLTLPSEGKIYLDVNCFIYSVERIDPYRVSLDVVWQAVSAGGVKTAFEMKKNLQQNSSYKEKISRKVRPAEQIQDLISEILNVIVQGQMAAGKSRER